MEILLNGWLIRIGWIVGLVLLVVSFWYMLKMSNPSGKKKNPSLKQDKCPLDNLKDKFARGEISKEEFEQKKEQIEGS